MAMEEAAAEDSPGAFMIAGMSWAILAEAVATMPKLLLSAMAAYGLLQVAEWKLGGMLASLAAGSASFKPLAVYGIYVLGAAAQTVVLASVAVAIHRLILRDETAGGAIAPFGARTLRFAGWVWFLSLTTAVALVPFGLAGLLPGRFALIGKLVFMVGAFVVVILLNTRLSLVLPAVAIDLPAESAIGRLRAAFDLSRGRFWRILWSMLLTFVPFILVTWIVALLAALLGGIAQGDLAGINATSWPILIVVAIGRVVTAAAGAAVLSWNFRIASVEKGLPG